MKSIISTFAKGWTDALDYLFWPARILVLQDERSRLSEDDPAYLALLQEEEKLISKIENYA